MATNITNRLGRSVLYTLSKADADNIRAQRLAAGNGTLRGNEPHEGETYPGIITRDWQQPAAEQQVAHARITAGKYLPEKFHGKNQDGPTELLVDPRMTDEEVAALRPIDRTFVRDLLIEARATIARQLEGYDKSQETSGANLQVYLDGNDVFWALSVSKYQGKLDSQGRPDRARSWDWPEAYIAEALEGQQAL